ncbi:MAG: AsmA family protein [Myxococcales bacterium]
MKIIRRTLFGLVGLVVVAVLGVYFSLNRIVKHEVETQGTASLRLATALDAARLSLFGGKVGLHGLGIASPSGFSAPRMLELGDADVAVQYKQLREQPIHVASLRLDKAKLVVEQSNGTFNFRKAMELQPQKPPSKDPMKLVIDEVRVDGAQVILRPGLPGIPSEITVPIPALTMKGVGQGKGANNGAAIKDVAMQIISAMAAKASESDKVPAQLKALLHLNAGQVAAMLGGEAAKQIAAAVPGEIGTQISKVVADPQAVAKDPAAAVKQGLGGLVGSGDQKPQGRAPAKKR